MTSFRNSKSRVAASASEDAAAAVQRRFGARVAALRSERGLTQAQLARAMDMDRSYLASIERGMRNVTLSNLVRLAGALGVTAAELLEGI